MSIKQSVLEANINFTFYKTHGSSLLAESKNIYRLHFFLLAHKF